MFNCNKNWAWCLLILTSGSAFSTQSLTQNIITANPYEWKFADSCSQSFELWRQEMNYWYDECLKLHNHNQGEDLEQKIDLIDENCRLMNDNELLELRLQGLGRIVDLNFENLSLTDLEKIAHDKQHELLLAKTDYFDRFKKNPDENPLVQLELEIAELEKNLKKAEEDCLKSLKEEASKPKPLILEHFELTHRFLILKANVFLEKIQQRRQKAFVAKAKAHKSKMNEIERSFEETAQGNEGVFASGNSKKSLHKR